MLEVSLAEKLIEQITKYTDYNVNIMNREGIIIASRNPDRIGCITNQPGRFSTETRISSR